jgi:hypothetical protein
MWKLSPECVSRSSNNVKLVKVIFVNNNMTAGGTPRFDLTQLTKLAPDISDLF